MVSVRTSILSVDIIQPHDVWMVRLLTSILSGIYMPDHHETYNAMFLQRMIRVQLIDGLQTGHHREHFDKLASLVFFPWQSQYRVLQN